MGGKPRLANQSAPFKKQRRSNVVGLVAAVARLELLEEVVALVVHQNEGGEILNGNFPDSLHAEFGVLHAFNALDATLRQYGSHATNSAEVETAMLLASIGHHLSTVTLGNHNQRTAMRLELVHIGVHTVGSGGAH